MRAAEQTYTCSRCDTTRTGDRFPKRGTVCKNCLAAECKARYWSDPEKYRARLRRAQAKYKANNKVRSRKVYSDYYARNKAVIRVRQKTIRLEASRRWKAKFPITSRVHSMVANALRNGTLVKEPCRICGCEEAQAHHCDYGKPLEVMWLCRPHHDAWHRVFEADYPEELDHVLAITRADRIPEDEK